MTQNRSLRTVLTTVVIVSVLVGAIAGPMVAITSEAQPVAPGETGTTVATNADTTTNTPVTGVTNTNTNTNANDLSNTNTNTNTNNATASAGARSTGSSLDLGNGNGTNGCALLPPGTDSYVELQKLLPENGSAGGQFGQSVAVDRATETIVVGAPGAANESGADTGAVYVFTCQGSQFVQTQTLLASDGNESDRFGRSVAIDGGTLVVGAPSDDNENGVNVGSAYVFERQGGQFVETQKLLANDNAEGDEFGLSVAIAGDSIVVGAPDDANENGNNAGAAYVFERQGGQFVETQKLLASDGAAFDRFGDSVAIDGDTIIVGAPGDNNENGENAGAAYVFERQGGQFVETQKLLASDGALFDLFGESVTIDGGTIAVGAFANNENGNDAGAAYVFERQGGQFVETQKLLASDGAADALFGDSVAIDGDTIIVGAPFAANESGVSTGAAYVFERQGGSFVEIQKLTASDGAVSDQFGASVAIDGWIVGGAPLDDNENGNDAGASYVFE